MRVNDYPAELLNCPSRLIALPPTGTSNRRKSTVKIQRNQPLWILPLICSFLYTITYNLQGRETSISVHGIELRLLFWANVFPWYFICVRHLTCRSRFQFQCFMVMTGYGQRFEPITYPTTSRSQRYLLHLSLRFCFL